MRLVVVSDLHNDFYPRDYTTWQPFLKGYEDAILVIAGDTANSQKGVIHLFDYWKLQEVFRSVVMIDGNHEHYNNRNKKMLMQENIKNIKEALPENVFFLDEEYPSIIIEGVTFIGVNGWYSFDVDNNNETLRDYNMCRYPDTLQDYKYMGLAHAHYWGGQPSIYQLAKKHANIVDEEVDKAIGKIVVITHTAPHRDMVRWTGYDQRWDDNNAFYVNAFMTDVMKKHGSKINYWVHGHTHDRNLKTLEGIDVIANPRGYPNENPNWEPIVIEI